MNPPPLIHTVKEMALALTRSEDYVHDMKRGGFRLPATVNDAVTFIHRHGPPRKFRQRTPTRSELYSHRPSCKPRE